MTGETNNSFQTSSNCGNSDGVCYRFSFSFSFSFSFTQQKLGATVEVSDVRTVDQSSTAPVLQSQQTDADDGNAGQFPCTDDPGYTCMAEAPTGDGVVAIHNDGKTVTIDNGNNGVDDTDEQHDYDVTTPASTREEAEAKRDAREAVDNIPEDSMVVIQAGNGLQPVEQQENAFSLEQQLWDRGEPCTVCFDPITYTNSNGEEVTVQSDCVVVVPYWGDRCPESMKAASPLTFSGRTGYGTPRLGLARCGGGRREVWRCAVPPSRLRCVTPRR